MFSALLPLIVSAAVSVSAAPSSLRMGLDSIEVTKAHEVHVAPDGNFTPGALMKLISQQVAAAKAAGETPIVEITDPVNCGACIVLDSVMKQSAMEGIFQGVRLITAYPSQWGHLDDSGWDVMRNTGYCGSDSTLGCGIPGFYYVDDAGHGGGDKRWGFHEWVVEEMKATPGFNLDKPEVTAKYVRPALLAFVEAAKTSK